MDGQRTSARVELRFAAKKRLYKKRLKLLQMHVI